MKPDLTQVKHIHFSGIKGVGMTALACYVQDMGIVVSGSDVSETFVTEEILKARKIDSENGLSPGNIPDAAEALIFSAARPHNPQIQEARKRQIPTFSYAQALGEFTRNKTQIAVCGVGGKTTTTAMIATILEKARLEPSYIDGVGGIPNLGSPGKFRKTKLAVIEADDYSSVPGIDLTPKFMYLKPFIAVVTNIEFDHPDVYENLEQTKAAFKSFFLKLPKDGYLIANIDNQNVKDVVKQLNARAPLKVVTYGYSPQADWKISKVDVSKRKQTCSVKIGGIELKFSLKIPGKFNVANACAAIAAATQLGVSQQLASKAMEEFLGTKRRFEKLGDYQDVEVWDDYAHHPTEIRATLAAARQWFAHKRIVVLFQPHTFSRTKALLDDFAKALSYADFSLVTDIYSSAREHQDATVSGKLLYQQTSKYTRNVKYIADRDLLRYLHGSLGANDVLLTLGAGDIYKIGEALVSHEP